MTTLQKKNGSDNGTGTGHWTSAPLLGDTPVRIGVGPGCDVQLSEPSKKIEGVVYSVRRSGLGVFVLKSWRASVIDDEVTLKPDEVIVLPFARIRLRPSSPPSVEVAPPEPATEGGGDAMQEQRLPHAGRSGGRFTDRFRVDLTALGERTFGDVFSNEDITELEADERLWDYLTAEKFEFVETEPEGGDNLEWMMPYELDDDNDGPDPGDCRFDDLVSPKVNLGRAGVKSTRLADVLGTGVQTATEMYDRLWTFVHGLPAA